METTGCESRCATGWFMNSKKTVEVPETCALITRNGTTDPAERIIDGSFKTRKLALGQQELPD